MNNYAPPPPKETNHLLHLILTLLTGGLWAFVWVYVSIINAGDRKRWEQTYNAPPPDYLPVLYDEDKNPWYLVPNHGYLPNGTQAMEVLAGTQGAYFIVNDPRGGGYVDYLLDPNPTYTREPVHLTTKN